MKKNHIYCHKRLLPLLVTIFLLVCASNARARLVEITDVTTANQSLDDDGIFQQNSSDSETAEIVTDASWISSPYTEPSEGSIEALVDNDVFTFWHSKWTGGSLDMMVHYLQFDLQQAYDLVTMKYCSRQNIESDRPMSFVLYGADTPGSDGSLGGYTELGRLEVPDPESYDIQYTDPIDLLGKRYIRVYCDQVSGSYGQRGYWHVAEMNFMEFSGVFVPAPVISPSTRTFFDPISITITAPEGGSIYYTTDGNIPSATNGVLYDGPVEINHTTTIKAVAIDEEGESSRVVTATYTCTRHTIGEDYNPSSPPDPISTEEQKKHQLLLVVNPSGAGYAYSNFSSDDKGRVIEGASSSVYTYSNYSSFQFVNWTCDGEVVSNAYQYNFTMPNHDVALVANFDYKPTNPSDPQDPVFKYPVTVTCQPSGAGWFNFSSSTLAEGETMDIHAYCNTNFRFKGWKVDGKEIEQTTSPLNITMGRKPISVVGLYDYYPSSPANPGANYWNPNSGQVIVDDFTTGNLYSTIRNLVGYDNLANISSIIVKGKVNDNDFGGMRNSDYTNLASLDITRVDGITAIPSYAFQNSHVGSIYLPSCITSVGSDAFYGCDNLNTISVYAMVPPTANSYTFRNFTNKENCVVRVPSEAISLYEAAPYWNEFTIMPLAEELHALQVNLPEDCSDGRYKNNRIELVNTASGARQKYVVTDRLAYTFIGLQKDETFNVYLFSPTGLEIGKIENVLMGEADQDITFSHLKIVKDASVAVKTPDGSDVTSQVTVEWYEPKADGTSAYLRKAATLGEVPVGQKLDCRFTLPQQLGVVYASPKDETFEVTDSTSAFTVNLVPLRRITLSGEVVDENGAAIKGATVSVNAMLNGKFSTTINAKTGRDGKWTATMLDAPEYRLTYAATECVNVLDTVPALAETESEQALEKVTMRSIAGARINYNFTYTAAHKQDVEGEFTEYYSDYKNVTVSVYNLTQNRQHSQLSLQYPTIVVLDENVKAGDRLRLTAHSATGAFNDIVKEVTVGEDQRANVQFDITGKGGIEARFSMTDNPSVIAMLYNANGALVKTVDYSEAVAKFSELADGEYSIVSIGKSSLLNGVQRLATLSDVGLVAGTDYVLSKVSVKEGIISEVKNDLVPPFDENRFCYTTSTTSFSVNKSSVTPGNYLTLRSTVDFKSMYKSGITDVKMIYDLPDNCEMVTGSVMKGNQIIPYEQEGKQIIVPLGNMGYTEQVRFVVIPTAGGDFKPTASVSFATAEAEVTQPVGSALCNVKNLELNVPTVVAKAEIPVSGLAPAKSSIKIYDDQTLIGEATTLANGQWNTTCNLINPYNLSEHNIYALITTVDNAELKSEIAECTYDVNAITISKVTMINTAHPATSLNLCEYVTIFDFQNPDSHTEPYWYWPSYPDFTFLIDFTNNSPEKVSNVVLYVHTTSSDIVKLIPKYDEKLDKWIATSKFYSNSLPTNVSLDFTADNNSKADPREIDDELAVVSEIIGRHKSLQEKLAAINDTELDEQKLNTLLAEYGLSIIVEQEDTEDYETYDFENMSEAEFESFVASYKHNLTEVNLSIDLISNIFSGNIYDNISYESGNEFKISRASEIDESSLLESGFETVNYTDGSIIYFKITDSDITIVDYNRDIYLLFTFTESSSANQVPSRINAKDVTKTVNDALNKFNDIIGWMNSVSNDLVDLASKKPELIVQAIAQIEKRQKDVERYLKMCNVGSKRYNVWKVEQFVLSKNLALAKDALNTSTRIMGRLARLLPVVKYIGIVNYLSNNIKQIGSDLISIPDPCEYDQAKADECKSRGWLLLGSTIALGTADLVGTFTSDAEIISGAIGSVATAGTSLVASLWGVIQKVAVQVGRFVLDKVVEKEVSKLEIDIKNLKCYKDPCENGGCPGNGGGSESGGQHHSGNKDKGHVMDPSGYVYEAVPENRVEGVQASIYYKETVEDMYGDLSENIVLWDAEEYAQKNPLFTDENGMYAWDVPQGLWQVKFEKDGYVTTQSEWLPVPPPQLEVNIPIVQNKQPEVVDAHAYETGIQITFDKYMDKATINAKNVYLTVGGKKVAGEVVTIEEEGAEANKYATTFRFVPEERLSMSQGEIRLTVSREVKSYAGIPMTANYSQVFDIEKEITDITTSDNGQLLYGGKKTITVDVVPFDASVGKILKVKNSSPSIMAVENDEVEIDENGQALVKLTGELPGQAMLTFSVEDSYATGEATINVVTELYTVDMPVASRASGTEVYRGTKVSLSTETPNATIYYTTDGSCPCDENGTRKKFILPIEITGDTDIKAMVETSNNEASEVAEFHYSLKKSDLDYTMPEGWTWISHNLDSSVNPEVIGALEPVQRIVSQTAEIVRDSQFGLVGNLKELSAEQSYKIESSATTDNLRLTDIARNPSTPINVATGWNWLGYTPGQTMSVAEAFSTTEMAEGDYIVGQKGFAQYNGSEWEGTLETLVPGAGYLFNSQDDKQVVYNTNIVSQAAAASARLFSSASPWAVDVNKYPQIMCMVVTLTDESGNAVSPKSYHFGAFSDSECRGIAKVVNGKYMMSVYGKTGDKIDFKLVPVDGENEIALSETMDFAETMIGSVNHPYMMKAPGDANSIKTAKTSNGCGIKISDHRLYIIGGNAANISNISIINLDGLRVFETVQVKNGEVELPPMTSGIYVVAIVEDGKYSYHKIVIK